MENKETSIVNQPAVGPIEYAGFWMRVGASIVDGAVTTIPLTIVNLFVSLGLRIQNNDPRFIVLSIIEWILVLVYFIGMTHYKGATLGKMVMGIKVVSGRSANLSILQVFVREISKIISALLIFIGYIMVGVIKKKQGLHDMIAGTVVVKIPGKKIKVWALVLGVIFNPMIILIPIAIIGIFASVTLASLNSARAHGQDAQVKANTSNVMVQALMFQDEHHTFVGFKNPISGSVSCSGEPIVNISPDGKNLAVLGKYCPGENVGKYYCVDNEMRRADVTAVYVSEGRTECISSE
jgi:uncharacterized RDD family membrane protein YckC